MHLKEWLISLNMEITMKFNVFSFYAWNNFVQYCAVITTQEENEDIGYKDICEDFLHQSSLSPFIVMYENDFIFFW